MFTLSTTPEQRESEDEGAKPEKLLGIKTKAVRNGKLLFNKIMLLLDFDCAFCLDARSSVSFRIVRYFMICFTANIEKYYY